MELLWIAVPVIACAAMMLVMMKRMGMGGSRGHTQPQQRETTPVDAQIAEAPRRPQRR